MSKYIDNVNAYLSQMKIKHKYVSLKSGIDEKKLSRILNGQKVTMEEMEKIAYALGQKIEYFSPENFKLPVYSPASVGGVAFYAGEPTREQQEFASKLLDFIENVDEIMGAESRVMKAFME